MQDQEKTHEAEVRLLRGFTKKTGKPYQKFATEEKIDTFDFTVDADFKTFDEKKFRADLAKVRAHFLFDFKKLDLDRH